MGYPEWIRGVPSRDLPWNDNTPDYWCEKCWEFATNNPDEVEFGEDEKGDYWICPDCKHRNYL